jgi:hypothetical protein
LDQQAIVAATIAASVHSALPDREDPVFFRFAGEAFCSNL